MLYFSPLSVTDDKQRDRKHPFSFPQCRQAGQNVGGGNAEASRSSLGVGCSKVWRIVPCVYKIYTLDRFQFHGLLKNNPIRFLGGGGVWMYVVRERCVFSVC